MDTARHLLLTAPTPGPVLLPREEPFCIKLKTEIAELLLSQNKNYYEQGRLLFALRLERSKRSRSKREAQGTWEKDLDDIGIAYPTANRRIQFYLGVQADERSPEGNVTIPEAAPAWEVEDVDAEQVEAEKRLSDVKAQELKQAICNERERRERLKKKRQQGLLPFMIPIYNHTPEEKKQFWEAYEFIGRVAGSKLIYEAVMEAQARKWREAENATEERHA